MKAEKAITDLRMATTPCLEIRWHPGELTFHYELGGGKDSAPSVHFRICMANTSKATAVRDIRVMLERLPPHNLTCVTCSLRLMNNILMEPAPDPRVERFSLNPEDSQFVDLMEQ